MTPDLLNFKKGWMSKLDEDGEWRKHWFVLTDTSLRYYRDSDAEEKDDPDGEICLQSCVNVSECDVDKNYGFLIETQEAMFTLSAVTSGIRKNWVEVITKTVLPSSSPDITQLPGGRSDKDTSLSRPLPSPRHSSRQTHGDSGETATPSPRPRDHAEPAPATATRGSPPTNDSEQEEGRCSRQQRRLEDRSRWFQSEASRKAAASSPWDSVVLKTGQAPPFLSEGDVEKRWAEFERQPLREAGSTPLTVTLGNHPDNEALEREAETLRQQLASLQGDGDADERGHCGPEAPWGRSLEVMERAHKQALEELQKQHDRELRELESEKEKLLREETQATARAMEALEKAHREELERELEKVRRQAGGDADTRAPHGEQQLETQSLQRELDDLSERYSQKCLELNRAEQSSAEREREISRREREMTQLRKENQELQSRLTEEINRMRPSITGQGSEDTVSLSNHELSSCDLEMLLRVKENELQYLHRETSCLRDELHSLNKEKRSACDRYKEVYAELGRMKSRSEQEIEALKEHLKLAMAALQEGQQLENNLEH
ncbi:TRIO and F-actin-binding protein-like isoform X2 [Conger conger]|uniref:TRIO and F-actin-binding protein-like isoform X2 n=1 Tax=Conger conger TaxID=82655 RepID=UPI002A59AF81|nr:TRIO and F-actin-binding protein-like isoform X2 [Conger conger]